VTVTQCLPQPKHLLVETIEDSVGGNHHDYNDKSDPLGTIESDCVKGEISKAFEEFTGVKCRFTKCNPSKLICNENDNPEI